MGLQRILIANRGEIARRIIRTCRAMGISTAAIYSDPDRDVPFVRDADVAAYIGPPLTGSSFLAIDKIIDIVHRVGADAVHPGYGFLAENADFAQACADAGIIFIGPSPESIRRMGSKIAAKEIAAAAGVPTIPGFAVAALSAKALAARVEEIGYPVLIKASAGGGGKGMRVVREPGHLQQSLEAARRESKASFGDDTLLIERYIDAPRHIEIQILGDTHGGLVHCFERECSIQRRYQKIIEESPSPVVDTEMRARMGAAATAVARAIGYHSAGTVEFVVDQEGRFYFLEVNTRLQVEHPVTEEVTGLDLVRLQIEIAEGRRLPFRQEDLALSGHAIECRIYAEDPLNDFLPSIGTVACWEPEPLPGLRYESGVVTGSEVTIHYDPMLAKVIAHGADRGEAIRRLAAALARLRVHGVRTNVPYLIHVLRHPEFLAGRFDTHFLERHAQGLRELSEQTAESDVRHAIAAALWLQEQRRKAAPVLSEIPSGWRNNPSQMQEMTFAVGTASVCVAYRLHPGNNADIQVDGATHQARIVDVDATCVVLELDDVCRTYHVHHRGDVVHVHSTLGSVDLREVPRFPVATRDEVHGGCIAPMPGKILAVHVELGQSVGKGDTLIILEAMKMEHPVTAPHDGVVTEVRVEIGQQVEAGTVLVVLEEAGAKPEGDNGKPGTGNRE